MTEKVNIFLTGSILMSTKKICFDVNSRIIFLIEKMPNPVTICFHSKQIEANNTIVSAFFTFLKRVTSLSQKQIR